MDADAVAVTGAAGFVGSAVVDALAGDCRVLGVDQRRPDDHGADQFVVADLLDAGAVWGALAPHDPDAVVHLGTIPSPGGHPDHAVFASNALSTYHVLDAAAGLGVETVALASSVNAMGAATQDPPPDVHYLPVDEAHPLAPHDAYGLGKQAAEVTADAFGRRSGPPRAVSSLRFPAVLSASDLADADPEGPGDGPRDDLFAYVARSDAAAAVRAAVEAGHDGHERFWVVADDALAGAPTPALIDRHWRDVPVRAAPGEDDALIDNAKAGALLDWSPAVSWRDR
ncbi:MAG: NAD-dependent epimerase/dehydratase family protein [Halobacteriaceae archaeon]